MSQPMTDSLLIELFTDEGIGTMVEATEEPGGAS